LAAPIPPPLAPIPPSLCPATGLRVASGLFHQHLLDAPPAPSGPTPLLWRSLSQWCELLRAGELEAVLLASICPAPVEGMEWLPLGRWALLLACRLNGPDSAAAPALHYALQGQQLAPITSLARQFLMDAGLIDADGQLTRPYRSQDAQTA